MENLAFLCLDHHTLYDSKSSQHKNFTMAEVVAARALLYSRFGHQGSEVKWRLVLDGRFSDFQKEKVESIAAHLQSCLDDPSLTIRAVREGSIELSIESSEAAFSKMKALVESGETTDILGHLILDISGPRRAEGRAAVVNQSQSERLGPFQRLKPLVQGNPKLRIPQRDGYFEIQQSFIKYPDQREVGIVLPVGCGKSGLITLAPFAVAAKRVLVVAPGRHIASQLLNDFDPANPAMFYQKCRVLEGVEYPEPAEIRGEETNLADLKAADVVVTNIQQLQGRENKWLSSLPNHFFDLILVDEGHHNVAESWEILRQQFPLAKIINFSATPTRADGQLMAGNIIYSFPIFRAIEQGYVKRLKAVVLNPNSLRYVRKGTGEEVEVGLDEVRRLGEDDSDFRRSIVSSKETLDAIVNASIQELNKLRSATGDERHKIIVSALNYAHCIQIVEAYTSRRMRCEYIHSKEDGIANERVLKRLQNHELDVIVQVRMLGEGFDHPYLSVAAVCSVFSSLSPFAQFIGRIMRVIVQDDPHNPLNQGTVIFHAGANIANRWKDFQNFSEADQRFFDELLPLEEKQYDVARDITPLSSVETRELDYRITSQGQVALEEIGLLEKDGKAKEAFEYLRSQGFSSSDYREAELLRPVPVTKQRRRQASRYGLEQQIRNAAAKALHDKGLSVEGKDLDRKYLGRSNWLVLKAAVDRKCNAKVNRGPGERREFTQEEIDRIKGELGNIVKLALQELIDGKS
jgi:superfamily II DNA or RNA helicase